MDEKKLHEILMRCCKKGDGRNFGLPQLIEGEAYYTSGGIVIKAPVFDDVDYIGESKIITEKLKTYIQFPDSLTWFRVPALLKKQEVCFECFGKRTLRKLIDCPECNGLGEFKHKSHYYTCNECDGSKKIRAGKIIETCPECNGTGESKGTRFEIKGYGFSLYYLRIISELPNAEIALHFVCRSEGEKVHALAIRYAQGYGLLMGMHK